MLAAIRAGAFVSVIARSRTTFSGITPDGAETVTL